ncbi:MAG: NTP/NDP exchange transporter [Phycisphaerales bacterium]
MAEPPPTHHQPELAPTHWGDRVLAAFSLRRGEGVVTLLSALTIFAWFLGWGMMRPLRDSMGVAKGADYVMWLIIVTAAVSLVVSPGIAWVIGRLGGGSAGRRRVPTVLYRFLALNLLVFAAAKWLTPEAHRYIVGYVFFVWASVANMAAVSVFWGLAADIFPRERSLRLYGLIALGATLGLIGGGFAARWMGQQKLDAWVFMIALAVMLEIAARLARAVGAAGARAAVAWARDGGGTAPREEHDAAQKTEQSRDTERASGGVLSGVRAVVTSPYLLGASAYLLIYTVTTTFFYLAQQRVVAEAGADQAARTAMSATISLWADGATLIVQLLLTGRILRWIGQGPALATTPLVTIAGLAWMGASPGLQGLTQAVVARRSVHFAVDKPGREALYTVIPPEQKYTAKSFIDTFVYRGGDVVGAVIENGLNRSNTPILWFAGPICVIGAVLGLWLGQAAKRKAALNADDGPRR